MKDNDEETNYVIASDTDSVYINLSKLVYKVYNEGEPLSKDQSKTLTPKIVKFLDRVGTEKIEPFIDKCYQDLATYMNAYDQKMFMKRKLSLTEVSGLQRKDMYSTCITLKVFSMQNLN